MDNFKTQVLLNPPNASLIGVGDVDGPTSSTDNAVVRFDGTGGKTIQNSTVIMTDNGDVSMPSTATLGLQLYNTVDQVTDYERLEALWSSNTAIIRPAQGGSGSLRTLQIGSSTASFSIRTAGNANGVFEFGALSTSVAGNIGWNLRGLTNTATSGTNIGLSLTPTYNQASGTAANTALKIACTETALGSGPQRFIECFGGSAATTSLFSVVNNGNLLLGGLTTDGTGVLQFPAGAANTTSGLGFATDTFLYRSAAQKLVLRGASAPQFYLNLNGTDTAFFDATSTTAVRFGSLVAGSSLSIFSANTLALTLDSSQNQFQAGTTTVYHGSATGAVNSVTKLIKAVTAIADNTATAVLTVTIPNAAHSAVVRVTMLGSLGAGGAIGANEASGSVTYDFAIARTAGVNAVTTASTAYGSAMANVAGAATITVTAAASAIAGAVGDPNTFTVNVTIDSGSGASANHTCQVVAEILNANATGVTLA